MFYVVILRALCLLSGIWFESRVVSMLYVDSRAPISLVYNLGLIALLDQFFVAEVLWLFAGK